MRGCRQAICAAIATLLLEDIMETGLMPEYLWQARSACHPASFQLYTRLDRTI
jgi:hypothetical protein